MKKLKKVKKPRNIYSILSKIMIVFLILGMIILGGVYAANYSVDVIDRNQSKVPEEDFVKTPKKDFINIFLCGINENLTDTMIYAKYSVKTGKLAYMSIPRDTYVTNKYCIGHKLNAIYRGKNIVPLVEQVEEMLNVKMDYYAVIDNNVLIDAVNAIGGVEVNVPIRMKYDDPTQKLHIDLQPGVQVLDGKKAEHFVRFRKNNDGTGYRMGDIDRVKVQQEFIKQFIKAALTPANLLKATDIASAVLKNVNTNVTLREATRYLEDIPNFKMDDIYTCTAQGTTPYIDGLSYFKMNIEQTRKLIEENFPKE